MTDWAPYDPEEFKRFRESPVGQRIAEIAAEPLPPNPAHGPACGLDACLECWLESQCATCDGHGEICTMRGQTADDDEFTPCPDCDGSGVA